MAITEGNKTASRLREAWRPEMSPSALWMINGYGDDDDFDQLFTRASERADDPPRWPQSAVTPSQKSAKPRRRCYGRERRGRGIDDRWAISGIVPGLKICPPNTCTDLSRSVLLYPPVINFAQGRLPNTFQTCSRPCYPPFICTRPCNVEAPDMSQSKLQTRRSGI